MPTLRAFALAVAFLILTLASAPVQFVAIRLKSRVRVTYPHRYHRLLCRMFGIRITVVGRPVRDRGVLMVANHTSYFDILIMSAAAKVSFVAKSEVSSWPLFGLMARLQRSVFVDRNRRTFAGDARDTIRRRLRDGDALVLFPEGTSTDGNRVISFKSALLGAVENVRDPDTGENLPPLPVQPVSISYVGLHGIPMGRENRPLFAWYGDMELLAHLWEALKAGPIDVVVEFHPPLTVDKTHGRKEIAALAEAIVRRGQVRALSGHAGATGGFEPDFGSAAPQAESVS
jgi:lyso-ornithine lipid O-acyltransferase